MKYDSAVRHVVSAETHIYSSAIVLLLVFDLRLHRVLTPGVPGMHPDGHKVGNARVGVALHSPIHKRIRIRIVGLEVPV